MQLTFTFFTFIIFKSLVAQMAMQETLVQSLGQEDPLEEEMATHFLPGKSHEQGGAWWATVHGVRHD